MNQEISNRLSLLTSFGLPFVSFAKRQEMGDEAYFNLLDNFLNYMIGKQVIHPEFSLAQSNMDKCTICMDHMVKGDCISRFTCTHHYLHTLCMQEYRNNGFRYCTFCGFGGRLPTSVETTIAIDIENVNGVTILNRRVLGSHEDLSISNVIASLPPDLPRQPLVMYWVNEDEDEQKEDSLLPLQPSEAILRQVVIDLTQDDDVEEEPFVPPAILQRPSRLRPGIIPHRNLPTEVVIRRPVVAPLQPRDDRPFVTGYARHHDTPDCPEAVLNNRVLYRQWILQHFGRDINDPVLPYVEPIVPSYSLDILGDVAIQELDRRNQPRVVPSLEILGNAAMEELARRNGIVLHDGEFTEEDRMSDSDYLPSDDEN